MIILKPWETWFNDKIKYTNVLIRKNLSNEIVAEIDSNLSNLSYYSGFIFLPKFDSLTFSSLEEAVEKLDAKLTKMGYKLLTAKYASFI